MRPIVAGAVYFAIVFAVGFVLGTIRVLGLSPTFGETGAVLIELPFILGASWMACGFAIRIFNIPSHASSRLLMGAVAFGFLISSETLLAVLLGQSVSQIIARYGTSAGAIGLAGQVLFGLFPLFKERRAD